LHEHRIIDHKTASLTQEDQQQKPPEMTGLRRSTWKRKQVDYKAINEGSNQQLTVGNTEFSVHVATDIYDKQDFEFKILHREDITGGNGV